MNLNWVRKALSVRNPILFHGCLVAYIGVHLYLGADPARASAGSETYSGPQPLPQVEYDVKQALPIPLHLLLTRSRSNPITWNGGHCQKLISDDSPSQGTYLSAIDPPPSSLDNDIHAANTSTAGFVPIIRSSIHSPSSVAVARSLRGEKAQELIDIIDQVGIAQSHRGTTPWCWGTEH